MDEDIARFEARRTRGCRCCGWLLLAGLLGLGLIMWGDYSRSKRMAETMNTDELMSTEQVEQFIAENDIKVKHEDGEWKAEPPWKQPIVDQLRDRFEDLASEERIAEMKQRAEDSRLYIRSLLDKSPEELRPKLDELKEQIANLTDRETVREAIEKVSELDGEWVEEEAQRLLDSKPGENIELYVSKLQAMLENVKDEDLRQKLRDAIDEQLGQQQQQAERGELPDINPETGEVPLVLAYLKEHKDPRKPVDWSFVKEVELDDGPAYSVDVIFGDGTETTYYIRGGEVVLVATRDKAADDA
ncbi:MAG: hypothetical protein H7A35_01645 [Planctomycetales bacterium]|nr:hypothetical protein [bacterium]UNM08761.1 MAG: hypothetical protein H7A35_01645 [Planctomycetales bacterium]